MKDLIERLEKAGGPDRALDWELRCLDGLENTGLYGSQPAYTASIDAALTLVPEGAEWTFCLWQDHRGNCAQVRRPSPIDRGIVPDITKGAATPAIALCIAALKARAAQTAP